jgi:cell division protein FtsZ
MPEVKPEIETFAKIKVVGVGGGGGSAVNRMIQAGVKGVEFIAVNTDLQALQSSMAETKLHIGRTTTRGLGSGMDPAVGRKAAEESQNELREMLKGSDMVFLTAGMGGGTGTGASPIIAELSRDMGILTIAVVTKPFAFEGGPRRRYAEEGLAELSGRVDTLITIPNDRIWQIIDKKTPLVEAFRVVDEVLRQGVQGISELITLPGLINVDFADVKTIMRSSGSALMGMGIAAGENRAVEAAKAAISSPLLEISIEGARGMLFTIAGSSDLTMYEVSEAAKIITEAVDGDAKIIFGAVIDENLKDQMKITVVATGFDEKITRENLLRIKTEPVNYFQSKPRSEEITEEKFNVFQMRPREESKPVKEDRYVSPSRPVVNANTVSQQQPPQQQNNQVDLEPAEEEDLEIPAFIRKKMM